MKKVNLLALIILVLYCPSNLSAQLMNDFIGINMRAKDGYPQGFKKFGTLREYHEWASDIGYDTVENDPSTSLNFDGSALMKAAFESMYSPQEFALDLTGGFPFGQDRISEIEIGNEMDKYWRGDKSLINTGFNLYQMTPDQFGAFLSANYDGACRNEIFAIDENENAYWGVKNFDPKLKVAMGGVAGMQGGFLEGVIDYAVTHRSGCSRVLPFDVVNLHHYCTTANVFDGMSGKFEENGTNELTNYEATYRLWDWNGFAEGHGVSPEEGGLRKYVEHTLVDLMDYANNHGVLQEFANSDVWISEFGYDSSLGDLDKKTPTSWVGVPQLGGSFQQTQADWLIRSYLELAAVEAISGNATMTVDKAMAFDYRDSGTDHGTVYAESGLLKDKLHNNTPKKAWFHVQTMRNVLGRMQYEKEFTGLEMEVPVKSKDSDIGDPESGVYKEVRVHLYKGKYKGLAADILVIWSPSSNDVEGELTLDFSLSEFSSVLLTSNFGSLTIITPQDGDEDGYHQAYDVSNNSFTLDDNSRLVSETPIYVVLNVSETEVSRQ